MWPFRWIAVLAFSALAMIPGLTWASEIPPATRVRAHLVITAPQDCATFASIATRVAKRSHRIEFVNAETGLTTLQGKIERGSNANDGVLVELVVIQPTGQRASRKIVAPNCEQGAEALALLITMSLDPVVSQNAQLAPLMDFSKAQAKTEPVQDLANRSSPNTRIGADPTSPRSVRGNVETIPSKPAEEPPRQPDRSPAVEPVVPSRTIETPAKPFIFGTSLGLWGSILSGPTPKRMPGVGLYGFLAFDRRSPFSLAFLITANHHWHSRFIAVGGTANFSLDVASLDVCLLRLPTGPLTTRLCGAGQLGRLSASGSHTFDAQSHVRLFAAAGGTALFQVQLPAAFELAGTLGLGWALTRNDFAFNPLVFYQTPQQVLRFGFGVGRRW